MGHPLEAIGNHEGREHRKANSVLKWGTEERQKMCGYKRSDSNRLYWRSKSLPHTGVEE